MFQTPKGCLIKRFRQEIMCIMCIQILALSCNIQSFQSSLHYQPKQSRMGSSMIFTYSSFVSSFQVYQVSQSSKVLPLVNLSRLRRVVMRRVVLNLVPSVKLTWQWKVFFCSRKYIFISIFRCYVSSLECKSHDIKEWPFQQCTAYLKNWYP